MARGQAEAANAQLATTNDIGNKAGAQSQGVFGAAWPAIQNQLTPSATTQSALTQLPMRAAGAAFNAADQSAQNRMAKTNNSAGFTGGADKLARDKAAAMSTAGLQGQEAVQNLQNEGVKNATGMFGTSQDTMAKMYGMGAPTLQARAAGLSGDQIAQGYIGAIGKPLGFGSGNQGNG
jgi:hypothetical protein